jgi:hypothetical protein
MFDKNKEVLQDDGHSAGFGEEKSVLSVHSNDVDQHQDSQGQRNADKDGNKEAESGIAAKESKAVRWIRLIAIAVVVLSTMGVALAVFFYMSNSERETFAYRFKSDSFKILESIGSTIDRSLGSVDAFAVNMVSSAKESNQTWPFVTLSDFPVKSSKLLTLSKGVLISPYCYVTHEQRPLWNNFTARNNWWVNETLNVQEKAFNKTFFGSLDKVWNGVDDLWHFDGPARENEFYYVGWQQYPVIAGDWLYSWDYWFYMDSSGRKVHETHQAVITSAYNLPDPNNAEEVAYVKSNAEWYRDYLPPDRDPYEPYSDILYVSNSVMAIVFAAAAGSHYFIRSVTASFK